MRLKILLPIMIITSSGRHPISQAGILLWKTGEGKDQIPKSKFQNPKFKFQSSNFEKIRSYNYFLSR